MNETEINEMSIKCPACNTENTAKSIMKEIEIPQIKIIYPPELSDHSQQLCPFQKLVLKWNPVQNQKDM